MKISNAARLIFWLAAIFAIGILVRAESSEKRANTENTRSAPLRIVDQNGRPAINGVPSATSQIVDVMVGPGFSFSPDTVNISVGDTVRWTWASGGHSVSSGPQCFADSQFCSPNDMNCFPGTLSNAGTVYQHTFNTAGSYSYICFAHCFLGMAGVVNVTGSCGQSGWSAGPDMPTPLVRAVGVYFQPNGNFYTVGGRTADTAGSDFQHVLQYTPSSNSWTQRGFDVARQPNEQYGLRRVNRFRHAFDLLRRRFCCRSDHSYRPRILLQPGERYSGHLDRRRLAGRHGNDSTRWVYGG